MLPKNIRLSREGFDEAFKAKRSHTEHFIVSFTDNTILGGSAVIVSKKVAKTSVARHALKRKVRALLPQWSSKHRILIITAKKGADKLSSAEIGEELSKNAILSTLPITPPKS
jgi:ribonuclease P protein component